MDKEDDKKIKNEENDKDNYIRNLFYDMDYGKMMITDSNNNQYRSDLFGRKKIKFLPNITGISNRYNKNDILFRKKKLTNLKISIANDSTEKVNNNISYSTKKEYNPIIRKFEGYSKFPRPKGPPLLNIPEYEIKEKQKRKVIEKLENYFNEDLSVKNDIIRKNENKGLSFLTKTLNEFDTIKHDNERLQKLIKNNLDEIKDNYKLKFNLYKKDSKVKALNNFRIRLLMNNNSKTINGRILEEPNKYMKGYYKIINKVTKKNMSYDNNNKRNRKIFNHKLNKKNIKLITEPNNCDDYLYKDFTLGKIFKPMNFGYSVDDADDKNNDILPDIDNTNENIKKEENEEEVKDKENNDDNNENIDIKINEDDLDKNEEENSILNKKSLDNKIKNNELSFISYMSENQKKYEKENNMIVKSIKRINDKSEHNNKLLKGYMEKEIEEVKLFQKPGILRLKTDGDLYKENLNLLKRTNKKAFLLQEQKDLYDLKLLKKKLQNQKINANNVMKNHSKFN